MQKEYDLVNRQPNNNYNIVIMTNLKELGSHLADKKISDYRACPTLQTEIDNWYGRMPTKADRDECRNMFNHIVPHLNSKQIRPIIDWAKKNL